MSNLTSTFRVMSEGLVAENMPFGSLEIKFTLPEHQPMAQGEKTERVDIQTYQGKEPSGKAYAGKAYTSEVMTARWLDFGSNRKTAPSVVRGETVLIWATADSNDYRWTPKDNEELRNTEVVVWGFAAAKDLKAAPNATDSMYSIEINTERGFVVLHTTTARGEVTPLTVYVDAMSGTFGMTSGDETTIFGDCKEAMIKCSNRFGSEMGIHEDRAWMKAPKFVTFDSPAVNVIGDLNITGECKAANFRQPANKPKKPYD